MKQTNPGYDHTESQLERDKDNKRQKKVEKEGERESAYEDVRWERKRKT